MYLKKNAYKKLLRTLPLKNGAYNIYISNKLVWQ